MTDSELKEVFQPSELELDFVYHHARGASQKLTLLLLLKCHQYLGYMPSLVEIPKQVIAYLCEQLNVSQDTSVSYEAERSRYRYYQQIRSFLQVESYSHGGQKVAEAIIKPHTDQLKDSERRLSRFRYRASPHFDTTLRSLRYASWFRYALSA